MATLSSSSTLAEVQEAYDDNASYEEDGSIAKARIFVTACRMLVRRIPAGVGKRVSIKFDNAYIEEEMQRARGWLIQNGGVPSVSGAQAVITTTFEDFR